MSDGLTTRIRRQRHHRSLPRARQSKPRLALERCLPPMDFISFCKKKVSAEKTARSTDSRMNSIIRAFLPGTTQFINAPKSTTKAKRPHLDAHHEPTSIPGIDPYVFLHVRHAAQRRCRQTNKTRLLTGYVASPVLAVPGYSRRAFSQRRAAACHETARRVRSRPQAYLRCASFAFDSPSIPRAGVPRSHRPRRVPSLRVASQRPHPSPSPSRQRLPFFCDQQRYGKAWSSSGPCGASPLVRPWALVSLRRLRRGVPCCAQCWRHVLRRS